MEYIVVSFRSRAHTIKFHLFLERNGYYSEIINTPKEAGVGCGLSVKVSTSMLEVVKKGVKITALSSFAGVFRVKTFGGNILIRSI
jgi:hypothetical protein